MKLRVISIAVLFFALPVLGAPPPLPDQYDQPVALGDIKEQPVLVIVTSERQLRQIQRWEKALRKSLPGLVSIRIADITSDPGPTREQVAAKLVQHAPSDVSVAIDEQNLWASEYELDTKEPCLLLFDANHSLTLQFRGRPRKALVAEVVDNIRPYFDSAGQNL